MTNLADLIGNIAKQAIANQSNPQNNANSSQNNGFGGLLGAVLGQALGGTTQNQAQNQTQNTQSSTGLDSILGSVLGQVLGGNGQQSSGKQAILMAVIPLILNWIQQQGGLQAALDKLRGKGLSNQVQSWVNPEQNNAVAPVSQVQEIFSEQDIQQVAQQTQSSPNDVYGAISNALPQVIDALTPQGERTNPQEANQDIQHILNLASQFFKR
ncbi:MAG: YidB family protein [Acinetobacter sp.]|nr:YidB family protein [Acinetobacter sp.]